MAVVMYLLQHKVDEVKELIQKAWEDDHVKQMWNRLIVFK